MRIAQRTCLLAATALLLVTPALAKPKTKNYPQSCAVLWPAVKSAVSSQHYNFADMNDSSMKGIVSTGNNLTGKRYLDITLTSAGAGCTVAIGGQFSGLAHNDKGDLFTRSDEALQATATKPTGDAAAKPAGDAAAKPADTAHP